MRKTKSSNFKKIIVIFLCTLLIILLAILITRVVHNTNIKLQKQIYPQKYSEYIEKYSAQFGVDEAFVYSVVKCESSFKPDAVSNIGARGLMQLTKDTFEWVRMKIGDDESLSYNAMFDAETNIRYGVFLLSKLKAEFSDNSTTLCAYHAGRGITNKWLKTAEYSSDGIVVDHIPYSDTNAYVKRVLKTLEIYNSLYYENK